MFMFDRVNEMVANAIMSGRVPIRGIPQGEMLPIEIDAQLIRKPDRHQIFDNELRLKTSSTKAYEPADFRSVTINWTVLDEFTREMWPDIRPTLKSAKSERITRALEAAYDSADSAGEKPPNVNEVVPKVKAWLWLDGYDASKRQIQELAQSFKHRRRQQGKTLRSE